MAVYTGASGTSFGAVVAAGCNLVVRAGAAGTWGRTWVASVELVDFDCADIDDIARRDDLAADLAAAAAVVDNTFRPSLGTVDNYGYYSR